MILVENVEKFHRKMEFSFVLWYTFYGVAVDGVPLRVPTDLQNEIKSLFKNMIELKKRGTNLFFTDIDKLKEKMLEEI